MGEVRPFLGWASFSVWGVIALGKVHPFGVARPQALKAWLAGSDRAAGQSERRRVGSLSSAIAIFRVFECRCVGR
jgi:hypothetical protein